MNNPSEIKSNIAEMAIMSIVPPLIQESLFQDIEFLEEYGLKIDSTVTFGDLDSSIKGSIFFDAIRKILSGSSAEKIIDADGKEWNLKNQSKSDKFPALVIFSDEQRFFLPDFTALSSDRSTRLALFDKTASDINFPIDSRDAWRNTLSERPLENHEVNQLHKDFCNTPVYTRRLIRGRLGDEKLQVPSLVPRHQQYFERLAGTYDGSGSVQEYAAGEGKKIFDQLLDWQPYEGFLLSLLLSSHSALTDQINVDHLEDKDLIRAFDFLATKGDRLSQLGAVEIGLHILSDRAEITPFVIRLIKQIRDDDIADKKSRFNLFSSLFILVDGKLSDIKLMDNKPPFYRRLVSLAQASLICRELLSTGAQFDFTAKSVFGYRSRQHFLQSLIDMRLEPHWRPDFAAAEQMKKHFLGRILVAAENHQENIKSDELRNLIFGNDSKSIRTLHGLPGCFIPGPLDGGENALSVLPSSSSGEIDKQMGENEIGPESFRELINSTVFFNIEHETAGLAVKFLNRTNYNFSNIESRTRFFEVSCGLALVSSNARNCELADSVRILIRRYRRSDQYLLSVDELIMIYLLAATSRKDLNGWREFIGDCFTELAFEDLKGEEANNFHVTLKWLCDISPELWISCSKADAALSAFNNKS